ncbi:MAG: hypothetical protein WCT41_03660 [Candidatus Paceibacterota bacterium]
MASWSIIAMFLVMGIMVIDGKFLPSQMGKLALHGIGNLSILGNLVLISAVLYVIGPYLDQCNKTDISTGLIIGMIVGWLTYFFVYQHGKYDDGLTHPLSFAGVLFMIYSGAVYAALGLFYLRANVAADTMVIWAVWFLLALYIPIANHVALDWINGWDYFEWSRLYPRFFAEEKTPLAFVVGGEIFVAVITVMKLFIPRAWL